MAKTDYQTADDYIAAQPEALRPVLEQVRAVIRANMPDAKEGISYQMPAYRVGKRVALYFAGWKSHIALYPPGPDLIEAFGDDLKPHLVSKGTLRFDLKHPLPLDLIGRIAAFRAAHGYS
jgi:uncharacterized protein YdhG (YjbR/CyaY superfamily)